MSFLYSSVRASNEAASPRIFSIIARSINALSTRLTFAKPTHKTIHKKKTTGNILSNFLTPRAVSKPDPATGTWDPWLARGFQYTGPLRAVYPLSDRREVPKSIKHPDYAQDGVPKSERTFTGRTKIEILDLKAQEGMRKVCRLAREVLDIAAAAAVPGVTTDYIDDIVHKACLEREVSLATGEVLRNC